MPKNLSNYSSLLMVTDTAMMKKNGQIYAFEPVVRELDVFLKLFEKVTWIGFERNDRWNDPTMVPVPSRVECILLPKCGGNSLFEKLKILLYLPPMSIKVISEILKHDIIHTRSPSSPAFFAAIFSTVFQSKTWWHKYAGNWGQQNAPWSYRLQRWWLRHTTWSKVTINGRWPGQPAHCLSFENPCLSEEERKIGKTIVCSKNYKTRKRTICFVGHLNEAKGAHWLLDALPLLSPNEIEAFHLIGDGPLRSKFEHLIPTLDFTIVLHGYCPRHRVSEIMQLCHLILLPSKSEGFPKVIAEGANYGCVPVVSDISTLSQYIHHGENGFLLSPRRLQGGFLFEDLQKILNLNDLSEIAFSAYSMAEAFTFERYAVRIQNEILSVEK